MRSRETGGVVADIAGGHPVQRAGLVGFAGGALSDAALLAAQRHLVVLAGLVQWVGGTGQSGLQLRNTCTQTPQLLGVSTQPGQLAVALLGTFDIASQMLTEPLDVVAGPQVVQFVTTQPAPDNWENYLRC
ncbi:MAG: hypothetical protein ACLPXZ_25930 [Mycobacterium sp.]